MIEKFLRLPNGKAMQLYSITITNGCILKFINTDVNAVKNFLGKEIIDYIDVINCDGKILESHNIYMKNKTTLSENTTIIEYETRIIKEAYTEEVEVFDPETNKTTIEFIEHDAITERIERPINVEMVTAILEKPSIHEEIDNIKNTVGILNPNNMTLDEFKVYHKNQIGKKCTESIENGMDVETGYGTKHFSYTIEDQSNIKDLIITAILTNFSLPLPYHADGELCNTYDAKDILKIYMSLSSNKTYHTTYCNVLNEMIMNAKDLVTVKDITYGMEITDNKYKEIMKKVNDSKNKLLELVAKNVNSMDGK